MEHRMRAFTRVFAERFEADDPDAAAKQFERVRVDIVRAQFEALGQGDLAGFLETRRVTSTLISTESAQP
jgi:hypothetical protein